MTNDFKDLIAKNILLEAKIEDLKNEIAELKAILKRNRNATTRQLNANLKLCRAFEKLEKLDIPEVDEILANA